MPAPGAILPLSVPHVWRGGVDPGRLHGDPLVVNWLDWSRCRRAACAGLRSSGSLWWCSWYNPPVRCI